MAWIFTVALLTMGSMGAKADVDIKIESFTGGKITAEQKADGTEVTVTLTVTPDKEKGYKITKDDIYVYATISPSATRADGDPTIGTRLKLEEDDPSDLSAERKYTVTVRNPFGIWVKEAKFTNKDDGSKGNRDVTVDYSGTYYIGTLNQEDGYYLCPTKEWYNYKSSSPFYSSYSSETGDEQPFLTTYPCKSTSGYDSYNAVWIVEKQSNGYYYIKHASDKKYLTYNDAFLDNKGRVRVHLEDSPAIEDFKLFKIEYVAASSSYDIISKYAEDNNEYPDKNKPRKYLNINKGNQQSLQGTTADNTQAIPSGGIIGFWTAGSSEQQGTGRFFLEPASAARPTITNNFDGTFTIATTTTGATIYYTTDGTTPTTSTTTTATSGTGITPVNVTQTEDMTVIKAIAKGTGDYSYFPSAVATYNIPRCEKPVIKVSGGYVTITCATEGATIYYTTDENPATIPSTPYTAPFAKGTATTIRAIAVRNGYINSNETILQPPTEVSSSAEMTDMSGNYVLASNFSSNASIGTSSNPFSGTIDGNMVTLSGLNHPLVAYANGATIKNVMLKGVQISGSGNVGAIVGEASGYTRIYNCGILPSDNKYENESSYVSSSDGNCGGLVGWLKDDSRVINCFSYANITGGTTVAGIVGYNNFASTAEESDGKYAKLKTAVVNCMFYGNITGGTTRYPVYGGEKILNNTATGINNYDFYRAEANLGLADNSHYNCSWPAQEEYLTKYEYYRYLLNSNRELCGWWVGAPSAPSGMLIADVQAVEKDASLMAKWVLDPSIAPYPILKAPGKYYSAINQDPDNRINPVSKTWESRPTSENTITTKAAPDTEGQKLGSITVTINKGGSLSGSSSKNIPITAMDIENNDFCYGKIQLPYYNSIFGNPNSSDWAIRYGGNYGDKVVVGWEITNVTGGTEGTLVKHWQDGYNFADRDCTNKDKERIFAQGGYYYVPNGVTAITITAKWADATYLDNNDNYYDRISVSSVNGGTANATLSPFAPAGTRSTTLGNGKTVRTGAILSNLLTGSVYEKAIVLVGNNQNFTGNANYGSSSNGFTVMSADFDLDEEPDYSLIWQLGNQTSRYSICPIRFDFLPVIEMGMAMKEDGSTQYYSLGCYRPLGHFEVTETSLIHFGQFEFGHDKRTLEAPLILNGGIYDQYTKGTMGSDAANDKINYIIIGGNVRIPSFTPGAHPSDRSSAVKPTRHCALNVMGGNIDYLYLTGNYNEAITPNKDNPHCYIDGGNIKQVAAAGKEGIDGDVFFNINHSVIEEFYGGSTMDQSTGDNFKTVKGNINVTVDNSKITKYCGGPKFGNMNLDEVTPANNKKVTTNATGTTFGVYYGGGNGGTSYVQYDKTDVTEANAQNPYDWNGGSKGNLNSYTPTNYRSTGKNYMADYEMEIVNSSAGTDAKKGIFRTYFYAAQFSATNTGPITNNLTDCKVLTSFYGGGNLGGVIGDVESTLTDTEVMGSAFGAGYSASVPEVTIYNKDKTAPTLNVYTGIITPTPDPDTQSTHETYTWCYKNKTTNVVIPAGVVIPDGVGTGNPTFEYEGKKYFYTDVSLEGLGAVTGNITLTINGNTIIDENGKVMKVGKSVYGGGEESAVKGNTTVTVNGGTIGTDDSEDDYGNVFGGGKQGLVEQNTTVTISGGSVNQSVYGGGSEADVLGNTNVSMTDGYIFNGIFGGGLSGSVGTFTRSTAAADVNIFGHTAHEGCIGKPTSCADGTGKCTIVVSGGQIGPIEVATLGMKRPVNEGGPVPEGWVWGAGRGLVEDPETHPDTHFTAYVNETDVTIEGNAFILESIIGGGEFGRVLGNTNVKIKGGQIGVGYNQTKDGKPIRYTDEQFVDPTTITNDNALVPCSHYQYGKTVGNTTVYDTYDPYADEYKQEHGSLPTGFEGGSTDEPSDGKTWIGCVFGGGSGYFPYKKTDTDGKIIGYGWVESAGWVEGNANLTISGGHILSNVYGANEYTTVQRKSTVTMTGGTIGVPRTQAQIAADPKIGHLFGGGKGDPRPYFKNKTNAGSVEVAVSGGIIYGSVFGGGESGTVKGGVTVTMTGGTVLNDVYGGGALADTQTDNWDATTGEWADGKTSASTTTTVRLTGGDILGEAYGGGLGETGSPAYVYGDVLLDLNGTTTSGEEGAAIAKTARGCAVNQVFGCNNVNGTPKGDVMVHVYATQNAAATQIANAGEVTNAKVKGRYDVTAVYGGGNLAAYEPAGGKTTTNSTNVIIDGCGLTSIQTVYGGGNAASTPATNVIVNGTFEIEELFGGGNGKDKLSDGRPNPGANVGYKNYTIYKKVNDEWVAEDDPNYDTKEERTAPGSNIVYGTGQASINVFGGTVHRVFGGSNTKGNVRQTAVTLLDEAGGCDFCVDEAYGGGKSAPMDAEAKLLMSCIPGLQAAYGGAEAAAIQGDVTLNITNGTFDRVFGGNNLSGTISGSITVNIEEVGCKPIIIGELYGGGNQAGYSVYGYDSNDKPIESGETPLYNDPQVNVKSFTSIGNIYGGGYGDGATMVGNPTVNINEVYGKYYNDDASVVGENAKTSGNYPIPSHAKGKMGAINNVFGGGNAARVIGNTTVNIGTRDKIDYVTTESGESTPRTNITVVGADIRGNVYGGGNDAVVTGNAEVVIGKKKTE